MNIHLHLLSEYLRDLDPDNFTDENARDIREMLDKANEYVSCIEQVNDSLRKVAHDWLVCSTYYRHCGDCSMWVNDRCMSLERAKELGVIDDGQIR